MNILQLTDALKYGLIGLGAILATLCFFLLTKEQKRTRPRQNILTSIYIFMAFSCVLVILGIIGQNTAPQSQLYEPQSGFAKGALNGTWLIEACDTSVCANSDFKVPAFAYRGELQLVEKNEQIYFTGYLIRKISDDPLYN